MDKDEQIGIGYQVYEYRKLGMRWCKLERIFKMSYMELKGARSVYLAYLEELNKRSI